MIVITEKMVDAASKYGIWEWTFNEGVAVASGAGFKMCTGTLLVLKTSFLNGTEGSGEVAMSLEESWDV